MIINIYTIKTIIIIDFWQKQLPKTRPGDLVMPDYLDDFVDKA